MTRRPRYRLALLPSPRQPRTREQCRDGARPCRWTACRFHLGRDPRTGALLPRCALDIAEWGGAQQSEVGEAMGVSRQTVSQAEIRGRAKARAALEDLGLSFQAMLPPEPQESRWDHGNAYGIERQGVGVPQRKRLPEEAAHAYAMRTAAVQAREQAAQ